MAAKKEQQLSLITSTHPQVKDVTVELVDVTPELAAKLLESNTNNRKIKLKSIEEYVEALKLGDWQFNGDPIRIAQSGRLLDGQHRLMAIVESGVTVPIVLVKGLIDKAQMTMDVGAKRTYADHLQLHGEIGAVRLASVVRTYATYQMAEGKRGWPEGRSARLSIAQLDRVLEENPELREAAHLGSSVYDKLRVSQSGLGVAFYVLARISQEDADFFWERAVNGDGLSNEGPTQPILKLREFISQRQKYEHQKAVIALGGIFKAWNAFRAGSELFTAAPRFGGAKPEAFPWPK